MIILYSTGCPKCKILEKKLEQKDMAYDLCTDINVIVNKGYQTVPLLEVDDYIMDFGEAVKWINNQ